jgi:NADPH-dependent 2,4-dienoyl-CoA reductase/sulfur reductase-like enzyme
LPNKMVIIGANASGVHAVNAAYKKDPKAQIILIERATYLAYSRCGITVCTSR